MGCFGSWSTGGCVPFVRVRYGLLDGTIQLLVYEGILMLRAHGMWLPVRELDDKGRAHMHRPPTDRSMRDFLGELFDPARVGAAYSKLGRLCARYPSVHHMGVAARLGERHDALRSAWLAAGLELDAEPVRVARRSSGTFSMPAQRAELAAWVRSRGMGGA